MALPELDIARARRWCEERVPPHARDQVRVECDVAPRHLTIVESRPPWREGARPGMDTVPHRPAPLHAGRPDVVVVLARP